MTALASGSGVHIVAQDRPGQVSFKSCRGWSGVTFFLNSWVETRAAPRWKECREIMGSKESRFKVRECHNYRVRTATKSTSWSEAKDAAIKQPLHNECSVHGISIRILYPIKWNQIANKGSNWDQNWILLVSHRDICAVLKNDNPSIQYLQLATRKQDGKKKKNKHFLQLTALSPA